VRVQTVQISHQGGVGDIYSAVLQDSNWKTTSICLQMEEDLNFLENGRRLQYLKMDDELNILANGRRPQYFSNGRQPQLFGK
jgi:hypothetical protein